MLVEYLCIIAMSVLTILAPIYLFFKEYFSTIIYLLHVFSIIVFVNSIQKITPESRLFSRYITYNVSVRERLWVQNNVLWVNVFLVNGYVFLTMLLSWVIIRGYFLREIIRFLNVYMYLFLTNLLISLVYLVLVSYTYYRSLSILLIMIIEIVGYIYSITPLSPIKSLDPEHLPQTLYNTLLLSILLYIIYMLRWFKRGG